LEDVASRMMFMRERTFGTEAAWMWRLVTTMSSYNEELVAVVVFVVKEDEDTGTSFLVAAYHSWSVATACSSSRS
jgi:hypothetical protein